MQSDSRSEISRLNRAIASLRAELATATSRADLEFLTSEIGALSGLASALAETIEFEP
jgi:hypothetical protein